MPTHWSPLPNPQGLGSDSKGPWNYIVYTYIYICIPGPQIQAGPILPYIPTLGSMYALYGCLDALGEAPRDFRASKSMNQ